MTTDTKARSYNLSSLHPTMNRAARRVTPQEVAVVDWTERKSVARFRAQLGTVQAVSLHPDGQRVATVGEEGIGLWSSETGEALLRLEGTAQNLLLTQDLLLVGQGQGLRAYRQADGSPVWQAEHGSFQHPALLAMSPDGQWLAWSAMGAPDVLFLNAQTGEQVFSIPSEDEIYALAFHPDGRRLASTVRTAKTNLQHHVQVWRLPLNWSTQDSLVPERAFSIPYNSVSVAVSPGGGTLATGDAMGAQLWDYASGSPERRLAERQLQKIKGFGTVEQPRPSLVSALRFSADGAQVVTDGEYLRLWDAKSGDLLWTFTP